MEADVYVRPIWQSEIRRGKYSDLAEELRHGTELFRDFDGGKNTEESFAYNSLSVDKIMAAGELLLRQL